MATQQSLDQAQLLYVAYYGRPADFSGQLYWAERIDNDPNGVLGILNEFGTSAEFSARFGGQSNAQLVNNLYQQMFDRDAEPAGLTFWVGELSNGNRTLPEIAYAIAEAAQNDDIVALGNKLAVAQEFTDSLDTTAEITAYDGNAAADDARDFLAQVDENTIVTDVDVDGFINTLVNGAPVTGETYRLTTEEDTQTGTSADDVFNARLGANAGVEGNTLNSADVLDGGEGSNDTLNAQLVPTGTVSDGGIVVGEVGALINDIVEEVAGIARSGATNGDLLDFIGGLSDQPYDLDFRGTVPIMTGPGVAIGPKTDGIEVVNVQAQAENTDAFVNGSAIDAGEMNGVQQWWSDNSRDFLQIEDIRSQTDETFFGMRETDPNVSYTAYFAATQLNAQAESQNSALRITIRDEETTAPNEFGDDVEVREVSFTLDGQEVVVDRDALGDPQTTAQLVSALQAALDAQGLELNVIDLDRNGSLIIEDPAGRVFEKGESLVSDGEGVIFREQQVVDPSEYTPLLSTNVVLDQAGNGSQGGVLNIGAMSGDEGLGQFDVLVGRDSHLLSMSSINMNPGSQPEGYLEVVNINSLGEATGDLTLGMLRGNSVLTGGELKTVDGRAYGFLGSGLTDVRVVDAAEFNGDLNAAINLTERSGQRIDSYFRDKGQYGDEGTDAVPFSYTAGNGEDIFTFDLGNASGGEGESGGQSTDGEGCCDDVYDVFVADPDNIYMDDDFEMFVAGGMSNDRFNFNNSLVDVGAREDINIDGGDDYDTVEVTTSSLERWGNFVNVEQLVIAGSNDTEHNLLSAGMRGLEDVRISTTLDFNERFIGDWDPVLNDNGDVWDPAGLQTTVRQIESQTDVTISGENQTLSATRFDNDVDQVFDCIDLIGTAANDAIEVTLDNTARGSSNSKAAGEIAGNPADADFNNNRPAELRIKTLDVDNVDTATLVSNGNRQAFNTVQNMTTSAGTIMLEGTQSLNLNVTEMGNRGPFNPGQLIDAENLTNGLASDGGSDDASLTLALSDNVTDGTSGSTSATTGDGIGDFGSPSNLHVRGTEGDGDVLQLYGSLDTSMRVREFETIQFGAAEPLNSNTPFYEEVRGFCEDVVNMGASGVYSATNDEGVDLYNIVDIDGNAVSELTDGDPDATDLTIDSLNNGDTVRIGDLANGNSLTLEGESNTTELNIELAGGGLLGWLNVNNAGTVNISGSGSINDLDLDDTVNDLNVTGNVSILGGELTDTLETIDLSGIVSEGQPSDFVDADVDVAVGNGSATSVLIGRGNVDVDVTALDTTDGNATTFEFLESDMDPVGPSTWVIRGFDYDAAANADDVIDLSGLGQNYSFADLDISYDGTNTTITSTVSGDPTNWEIVLVGDYSGTGDTLDATNFA